MKEISIEKTKILFGGGINFSGALINAIKGYINTVLEIGQTVGGAIRRISSGNLCKF